MSEVKLNSKKGISRTKVALLISLCTIFIAINIWSYLVVPSEGNSSMNEQWLTDESITAMTEGEFGYILATVSGKLMITKDQSILDEIKVEATISDIVVSNNQERIYVGTSIGEIIAYDAELNEIERFKVNGKVVNLVMDSADHLIVAHGVGRFTDRYWVTKLDEAGGVLYSTRVSFDIEAIAVSGEHVYYATANSRVGLIDANGSELWVETISQSGTTMDANLDKQLLVGDERGNLYVYNEQGELIWTLPLSSYSMTAVKILDDGRGYGASDSRGNLFLINEDEITMFEERVSEAPILILNPLGDDLLHAMSKNGELTLVKLDAAMQTKTDTIVRIVILILNILIILTVLTLIISMVGAWKTFFINKGKLLVKSRTAYLLIFPAFLMIFVFEYIPTFMAVLISFSNFSLSQPFEFIGLKNFLELWDDSFFWIGMGNMVIILITGVIKVLTVPLLIAELIYWLKNKRLSSIFRSAFVLPYMVPGIVITFLWRMMYEPEAGLINQMLQLIGLDNWQRAWLGDDQLAIWSIVFAGFPYVDIFAFLILFGGLIAISREVHEAAQIDGVNVWQRFWKIDVPMLRPQISLVLFFTFISAIQNAQFILIMTNGGPGVSTYVPSLQMYFQIADSQFGYASAIGLVLSVIVLLLTYLNSKIISREAG